MLTNRCTCLELDSGVNVTRRDQPGARVWVLMETDDRYGTGDLHMTVESIDWESPQIHEDENWYEVRGVEFTADGRFIGPRRTMIRASRLHPSR